MATGPAGPPAVSSNRTYSTTPQRVRRYLKSGVMLGGRKAGCCGGSFEHCYLLSLTIVLSERRSSTGSFERWYQLTPKIALSERRSSTQRVHSLLERLFPGGDFWARLTSWYESKYRSGLLALFCSSVPTSWNQKASSGQQETPYQRRVPNRQYGDKICGGIRENTPAGVHIAGLQWNQWRASRSPPYCKPIPQTKH